MLELLLRELSQPWEGGAGPDELLFESIEPCPIDDHLTIGVVEAILLG